MTELRDKLLLEVGNLNETDQSSEHIKGYREALKNIAQDIESQILELEKSEMIDFAYSQIRQIESELGCMIFHKVPEELFNEIYNEPT